MNVQIDLDASAKYGLLRSLALGVGEFAFNREFAFYSAGGQAMEPFFGPLAWRNDAMLTPGEIANEILTVRVSKR